MQARALNLNRPADRLIDRRYKLGIGRLVDNGVQIQMQMIEQWRLRAQ